MSKKVGYARVSSREQNLDRQIIALKQFVDRDMIVVDKASGKDTNRPGYTSLKVGIGKLSRGDELYIKSLDRLSRNKEDIKKELKYFSSIGVRVKVLDLPTTMNDFGEGQDWIVEMVNNVLIEVLSSIAEQERLIIKQRQAEGIAAMPIVNGKKISNRTGKPTGRPIKEIADNWESVIDSWQKGEITAVQAMQSLGMKKTTFYRKLKNYGRCISK